jgi:hypothetical protein
MFEFIQTMKAQASCGIRTRDQSNRTFQDHLISNVKTKIRLGSIGIAEKERRRVKRSKPSDEEYQKLSVHYLPRIRCAINGPAFTDEFFVYCSS